MAARTLTPHPTTPEPRVRSLRVEVQPSPEGALKLRFELRGDIDQFTIPGFTHVHPGKRLWEHTCFELFLRARGHSPYCELNFSPSGAWAAYAFAGYREDMTLLTGLQPDLQVKRDADYLQLESEFELRALRLDWQSTPLEAAVSAVLEDRAGQRSYWAMHHAASRPDFHHRRSFVLQLTPAA